MSIFGVQPRSISTISPAGPLKSHSPASTGLPPDHVSAFAASHLPSANEPSKQLQNAINTIKDAQNPKVDLSRHAHANLIQAFQCIFNDCKASQSWHTLSDNPLIADKIVSNKDVRQCFLEAVHKDLSQNTPLGKILGRVEFEDDEEGTLKASFHISKDDLECMLDSAHSKDSKSPLASLLAVLGSLKNKENPTEDSHFRIKKTPFGDIGLYKVPYKHAADGAGKRAFGKVLAVAATFLTIIVGIVELVPFFLNIKQNNEHFSTSKSLIQYIFTNWSENLAASYASHISTLKGPSKDPKITGEAPQLPEVLASFLENDENKEVLIDLAQNLSGSEKRELFHQWNAIAELR